MVLRKNPTAAKLTMLCCLLYFTSYVTRLNYAASISEIIHSMNITKSLASLAVTGSFITYGLGQLVSGPIGDKVPPEKFIFTGLLATALDNLLISFCGNILIMTVLWCFNGFFQAMLWPPLVRIMAENLTPSEYCTASVKVTASASIGTIAVYIFVPICIRLGGWRLAFIVPAVFAIAVAFFWINFARGLTSGPKNIPDKTNDDSGNRPVLHQLIFLSGAIPVFAAIVLQGTLRDGLTTWMPSYINDIYHMGTSVSILTTALLPLFSIFSIAFASVLNTKVGSELQAAVILFIAALVSTAILMPFFSSNAFLSVALMAVITGCMHGINMLLISRLPARFEKYGCVSTMSGIFNAFTYIGSAISTYGIAALSENFGWNVTIASWILISLLGVVACLSAMKRWHTFFNYTSQS